MLALQEEKKCEKLSERSVEFQNYPEDRGSRSAGREGESAPDRIPLRTYAHTYTRESFCTAHMQQTFGGIFLVRGLSRARNSIVRGPSILERRRRDQIRPSRVQAIQLVSRTPFLGFPHFGWPYSFSRARVYLRRRESVVFSRK